MQRAAARSSVDTSSTLGRTASGRSGKRSQFLALRFCAVLVLAAGATLLALQSVARSAAAKLPAPPEAQAGAPVLVVHDLGAASEAEHAPAVVAAAAAASEHGLARGAGAAAAASAPPVAPLPLSPLVVVHPDPFNETNVSCVPPAPLPGLGGARRLAWVAPPGPNGNASDWPVNCAGREALCDVLRRVAVNREVMAAVANSAAPGLQPFLDSIKALAIPNFLVVAIDQALADRLQRDGVPHYFVPNAAQGNHKVSAQKFSLLKSFVSVGCSVLLTDTDVLYLANPFPALHRDSDVESMSDGWNAASAFGWLDPLDDAAALAGPMRRGHTLRATALNSGLWFVTATAPTLALMAVMEHRMATEDLWDQAGYNMELFLPTHDAHVAARATVRVMSPLCFVNSKVLFRIMRFKPAFRLPAHRPVAIHVNYHSDKSEKMKLAEQYYLGGDAGALDRCGERSPDGCAADPVGVAVLEAAVKGEINDGFASSRGWGKAGPAALRGGCAPQPAWGGAFNTSLVTYDLPFRVPFPGLPLRCAPEAQALCSAMDAALASAPAAQPHELLLCVVDGAHAAALPALLRSLDALALAPRAVVVLLDDAAAQAAAGLGGAPPAAQLLRLAAGSPLRRDAGGAALPPAAVKWALVQLALRLGVSPLVADPGTVFLANPFEHLYRDADVEAASDGWDEASAWGYDHVVDDPLMGWSRYCHGTRVSTRDPGLVLLQASEATVRLAGRTAAQLAGGLAAAAAGVASAGGGASAEADAADAERLVFNAESHLPAHGGYVPPGVGLRAMGFLCFVNDKTLLRHLRRDPLYRAFVPVAVRLTHTPFPAALGEAVLAELGHAKRAGAIDEALAAAGAKAARPPSCALNGTHTLTGPELTSSPLAGDVAAVARWSWGGMKPFVLKPDGALATPWGAGTWGLAGDAALFAAFAGATHVLEFPAQPQGQPRNSMFISTRCSDGEEVIGRAVPAPPPAAAR